MKKGAGHQKSIKNRWMRGAAAVMAAAVLCSFCAPVTVCAGVEDTKKQLEEAQQQKRETEQQKKQTQEHLGGLEEAEDSLQGKLSQLNAQLEEVSLHLEELEDKIVVKEAQIETAKEEVRVAVEKEEWQYECMKKRIAFLYEEADYAYLESFLNADSFSDFLNKSDYIEQIHAYDRKMLIQYQETRRVREEKEAKLEEEMAQLDALRQETKEEQAKVSGYVSQTSASIADYKNQIAAAEQQVEEMEAKMAEQDKNIAALQKKLAEEIALSRLAAQSKWRNISEVTFAPGDRDLLAAIIYCEAGNQPAEGKLAVGAVVINRVLSSVFPDTVVGVIYQGGQFSPVSSGKLALALAEGRATQECYAAADAAMSGMSNVGNCVYFRQPVEGLQGIRIGNHIFY